MKTEDKYKISIETRNLEIGLFWQRSNYFLVLNTAIAVGFFSLGSFPYQVTLSSFGVLTATLWFLVNLGSKYWQSRWEQRVSILEKKLGKNIELFSASKKVIDQDVKDSLRNHKKKKKLSTYDKLVLRKPSVSKVMSLLSAFFILFWVVTLALSVLG